MLRATWKAGSLRFWIGVGMAIAVLPLLLSAVLHHVIVVRSVIGDFQDVAARQRHQLIPAQKLQVSLWEASDPVDLYLAAEDPQQPAAYRLLRSEIETRFAHLHGALVNDPEARALVERAQADWTTADQEASRIFAMSTAGRSGSPEELGKQFAASIAAAVDKLSAVDGDLARKVDGDHLEAGRSAERADWIAAIAAGASLLAMAAGILIIGYLLSSSVDRLVAGAARFAAGERDHRIDVLVPPELHRVAEEFNQMIVQIRDSELALAELARRDRLTGLYNRRALEEMLRDALARHERLNEGFAVVLVDIDLFKQINDTRGHAAGDEVLRIIAGRLSGAVREIDKTFRFGGEEFVVLLANADRYSADTAAERIRAAVAERPVMVNGVEIPVTISAGVATTGDSANAEGLLAAADAALYRAKADGRNRVVWAGLIPRREWLMHD
jgi:diguanylate cyclase (GGDEF)-like protein